MSESTAAAKKAPPKAASTASTAASPDTRPTPEAAQTLSGERQSALTHPHRAEAAPVAASISAATARTSATFFDWVRTRGTTRGEGFIGGVCAGLAQRTHVDPVVIRGLFVVAALLGLPMLLIYAVAWALLPDASGRIPFERSAGARAIPERVGIVIVFLLGLVPVVPWAFGALIGSISLVIVTGAIQVAVTLVLIAVITTLIFLFARGARRYPREAAAPWSSAPPSGSRAGAPLMSGAGAPATLHVTRVDAASSAAASTSTDTDLATWRESQEAWKQQDAAWRAAQQDAEYLAREQARREQEQAAAAFAAEVTARRLARQASRPRTSVGFVLTVLGLAVIAGALVALWQADAEAGYFFAPALGILAAAGVTALGMVLAGILRRRSGLLTFVAGLLLVLGLSASAVGLGVGLHSSYSTASLAGGPLSQPVGYVHIQVSDIGDPSSPVMINRRTGETYLWVEPGVQLHLVATIGPNVDIVWMQSRPDGSSGGPLSVGHAGSFAGIFRSFLAPDDPITTHQTVRITQDSGRIYIETWEGR